MLCPFSRLIFDIFDFRQQENILADNSYKNQLAIVEKIRQCRKHESFSAEFCGSLVRDKIRFGDVVDVRAKVRAKFAEK